MKRYFVVRDAFLGVVVTLLFLTAGTTSILAEDQKPAAAVPAPTTAQQQRLRLRLRKTSLPVR